MDTTFWQQCADRGIVIVPVRFYSQYDERGNIDEPFYVGLRFVALKYDLVAAVKDGSPYIQVEAGESRLSKYFRTPEGALAEAMAA